MDIDRNLSDYIRVLKLARTPDEEEFRQVALVAGIGILLIGILGFLIFVLMRPLPP